MLPYKQITLFFAAVCAFFLRLSAAEHTARHAIHGEKIKIIDLNRWHHSPPCI